MLEKNNVGANIKKYRESQHKTQQQIAEAVNIQTSQLSAYENGKRTPNIDTLARIAKALEVSIDELYYGGSSSSQPGALLSEGHLIARAMSDLYNNGVLGRVVCGAETHDAYGETFRFNCITISGHLKAVDRLLKLLADLKNNRDTYSDPENRLNEICESVAKEIDR